MFDMRTWIRLANNWDVIPVFVAVSMKCGFVPTGTASASFARKGGSFVHS
jgi:hypothetical protein